jgi:hypothetical protein
LNEKKNGEKIPKTLIKLKTEIWIFFLSLGKWKVFGLMKRFWVAWTHLFVFYPPFLMDEKRCYQSWVVVFFEWTKTLLFHSSKKIKLNYRRVFEFFSVLISFYFFFFFFLWELFHFRSIDILLLQPTSLSSQSSLFWKLFLRVYRKIWNNYEIALKTFDIIWLLSS